MTEILNPLKKINRKQDHKKLHVCNNKHKQAHIKLKKHTL